MLSDKRESSMKKEIVVVIIITITLVLTLLTGCFERTPTEIVLENRYEGFGFSLNYSNDMVLEEQGFVNTLPDEDSGILFGDIEYTNTNTYHILKISWIYFGPLEGALGTLEEILESSIDAGFLLIDTEAAEVTKEDIQESTIEGYKLYYQPYIFDAEDVILYGILGVWYCNENQRIYSLNVGYSEENVMQVFQDYINSFNSYENE